MTSSDVRSKTVVKLLLLSFVFDPCFIMQYLVYLLFWQSSILAGEERASCLSAVLWLCTVLWVGLLCAVVVHVFPGQAITFWTFHLYDN